MGDKHHIMKVESPSSDICAKKTRSPGYDNMDYSPPPIKSEPQCEENGYKGITLEVKMSGPKNTTFYRFIGTKKEAREQKRYPDFLNNPSLGNCNSAQWNSRPDEQGKTTPTLHDYNPYVPSHDDTQSSSQTNNCIPDDPSVLRLKQYEETFAKKTASVEKLREVTETDECRSDIMEWISDWNEGEWTCGENEVAGQDDLAYIELLIDNATNLDDCGRVTDIDSVDGDTDCPEEKSDTGVITGLSTIHVHGVHPSTHIGSVSLKRQIHESTNTQQYGTSDNGVNSKKDPDHLLAYPRNLGKLYTCYICGKQRRRINEHMRNVHFKKPETDMILESAKTHQCSTCGKKYHSMTALECHKANKMHRTGKQHTRYLCGKRKNRIREHIRKVHFHKPKSAERKDTCPEEDLDRRVITSPSPTPEAQETRRNVFGSLTRQPNKLTNMEHYSTCEKKYQPKVTLEQYATQKTHRCAELYQCYLCGKRCRNIKEHMRKVHFSLSRSAKRKELKCSQEMLRKDTGTNEQLEEDAGQKIMLDTGVIDKYSTTPGRPVLIQSNFAKRIRESRNGMHEPVKNMHQSTQGMHESEISMHQSTKGMNESTQGVYQSPKGMHQSTVGMLESSKGIHQSTKSMHQSPKGMHQSPKGMRESTERIEESTTGKHGSTVAIHESTKGIYRSTIRIHESTKRIHESPKGIHESTKGMHQFTKEMHESTNGIHESTKGIHESTKGIHESTKESHESTKRIQESTKGLHQFTKGIHESTKGVHESTKEMHQSTKGMHEPTTETKGIHESSKELYQSPNGMCHSKLGMPQSTKGIRQSAKIKQQSTKVHENENHSTFPVRHARVINTGDELYQCYLCAKRVKRIKRHMRRVHFSTPAKKLICNICLIAFRYESNFERHVMSHSKDKKYKCSQCDNRYKQKHTLTRHLKVHHQQSQGQNSEHKCHQCDQTFSEPNRLIRHLREHSGEKPFKRDAHEKQFHRKDIFVTQSQTQSETLMNRYVCRTCGVGFFRRKQLLIHRAEHAGQELHGCQICGRKYAHKNTLAIHMKSHSGTYRCGICKRDLSNNNSLKVHLKGQHGVVSPGQTDSTDNDPLTVGLTDALIG